MRPTAVILVVGLSQPLLRHAPRLSRHAQRHGLRTLKPALPAVTCSVQASMLTGLPPSGHGVVGNGWYHRELCEVQFWKQSNRLVHGERLWDEAKRRDASFTCANLFWWFNMYSSVDLSVTPRPIYKADGRKLPDVYTHPPELRDELQRRLGTFPLFQFWGPGASIASTRWIAEAALHVHAQHRPTLTLVYLPHLDYPLQKLGPSHAEVPGHVRAVDEQAGRLLDYFEAQGVEALVVSEYGIDAVGGAVAVNVALREAGLLRVRVEEGGELLDAGASDAFAVADHQVAHVVVNRPSALRRTREVCESLPGVERVLDRAGQAGEGINHERAGDLVLVSEAGRWFSYGYWLDDARAPDFARTVDIHRKPGYDPCELFIDPAIALPKLRIAAKLLRKKLGLRTLMDVIPLDASLVRGSHGRVDGATWPVAIGPGVERIADGAPCTSVRGWVLGEVFGG